MKRCLEFNAVAWHDSRLLGLVVTPTQDSHSVIMNVELFSYGCDGHHLYVPVRVMFSNCTIINAALDLDGKRVCGGAISTAICMKTSSWKSALQSQLVYEDNNALDRYLHFQIALIPPGGIIDILAEGFDLDPPRSDGGQFGKSGPGDRDIGGKSGAKRKIGVGVK
ncbi:MAG: hypothetical protein ACT4QB_07840 [Gammaproteobacteria bacterium]